MGVLALGAALVAPGCEQIADFPERAERKNIASCADSKCTCVEGFDDCDGNLENGCEAFLGDDDENCGACGHACLGGTCDNSLCSDVVVFEGEEIAGPAIFGDRIFIVDELTGDLLASPLDGELDFKVIHSQPKQEDHAVNLAVGADGLYVILSNFKYVKVLRVDASETVTEPIGSFGYQMHSDFVIAPTTEAIFYSDGSLVYRVDRTTLERKLLSNEAGVRSLAVRGEDVFFAEDDNLFTVRPVAQGGGEKEILIGDADVDVCRIFPLETGFAVAPCFLSGGGVERWDAQGNLVGRVEGDPNSPNSSFDVFALLERGDELYFLDDTFNGVHVWDGASSTSTALTVTPFGSRSFKLIRRDDVLYWGFLHGVMKRRLPPSTGVGP